MRGTGAKTIAATACAMRNVKKYSSMHVKKILKDILHSGAEHRYVLIGNTKKSRLLFVVFTVRREKLRIISARNLNKKERTLYHE